MFKKAEEIQKQLKKDAVDLHKHIMKVEEFQISGYHITTKGRIAEGGFGFIDLVVDNMTRTEYVLKRCSVQMPEAMETVRKEVHILQLLTSPYIVKILGTDFINAKQGREALILMEYCPGGHLLDRLQKREGKYIPEKMCFRFFQQFLTALNCLHSQDPYIVHRDLKLENILIAADGTLRLCDFGSCVFGAISIRTAAERAAAEHVITKETTPIYRAPELIDLYMREELTEKTDIWAAGCIFYALCYLKLPFHEGETLKVLSDKISYPSNEAVTESMITCMKKMLDYDAEARPSVGELLSACESVAADEPIHTFKISQEAVRRRAMRETATSKAPLPKTVKKPTSPVIPARSSSSAVISAAAAKRMAAMKGVSAVEHTTQDTVSHNVITPSSSTPLYHIPFATEHTPTTVDPELTSEEIFSRSNSSTPVPQIGSNLGFDFDSFGINQSPDAFDSGFPDFPVSRSPPPNEFPNFFEEFDETDSRVSSPSVERQRPTSVPLPSRLSPVQLQRNKSASSPQLIEVDLLNMDFVAPVSLIDTPIATNKTSIVLSLFDSGNSDPFLPKKPVKPPLPREMKSPPSIL